MFGSNVNDGIFALSFFLLFSIATLSHTWKPDQIWHEARSMRESIKTLSWRYAMRSAPFDQENDIKASKMLLARFAEIQENSRSLATQINASDEGTDEFAQEMQKTRALPLKDRLSVYLADRVLDQHAWYLEKSAHNRRMSSIWYFLACVVYVIPFLLIIFDGIDASTGWPIITLFLVAGSSALGWSKSKRYRTLARSYAMSAHDIDLIEASASSIRTNEELSEFVSSAELAFSKEHTYWTARKS